MASPNKNLEIFKLCKRLHRTVQTVFKGDLRAQLIARDKIRSEFYNNKGVTNEQTINELIKYGYDCENVLKNQVIQAVAVDGKENVYRATVIEGSLVEHTPFNDDVSEEEYKASIRAETKRKKAAAKSLEKALEKQPGT